MFFCRLKGALASVCALAFALAVGLAVKVGSVCQLSAIDGERTFYLYSASSQGARVEGLRLRDIGEVRGESVRFFYDGDGEALARAIFSEYGAKILFTERCGEKICVYGYVAEWKQGVSLYGERVNLHIAYGSGACSVGTPMIFDGY